VLNSLQGVLLQVTINTLQAVLSNPTKKYQKLVRGPLLEKQNKNLLAPSPQLKTLKQKGFVQLPSSPKENPRGFEIRASLHPSDLYGLKG